MNFKGLTLIVFILILIISCEDKNWDNPYDEESSTNLDWAPFISNIEQEDESVVLEFGCNETNFDSYVIEKSVDNGSFGKVASPAKNATEWVDNNITKGGKLHKYKIYAKAGNNKSNSDEAEILPKLAPKVDVSISEITSNSFSYNLNILDDGGSSIFYYICEIYTDPNLSNLYDSFKYYEKFVGVYDELKDTTTYYLRFFIHNSFKDIYSETYSITTRRIVLVNWNEDQTLYSETNDFYTIHEFENLNIGDDVEITNHGTSEVIIKVKKTLTLGKNAIIRVRNGYYEEAPKNRPEDFVYNINSEDLLFPKTYGIGGDGGDVSSLNDGGGGGGGFGGGHGGDGGSFGYSGSPNGGRGGLSYYGTHSCSTPHNSGGGCCELGGHGSCGEGGGGNGGDGGGLFDDLYGGGGGGYGGGVLVITANSIKYDDEYPPKFIVSGQKGGNSGNDSNIGKGENGQGGILIINCSNYLYNKSHWNLGSNILGKHRFYQYNGGHGIVTGNPTKVYINGVKY